MCGTNQIFSLRGKYKKIMWQKNEESAAAESAKGRLSRFILSASAKDLEISDHRKDKKKAKKGKSEHGTFHKSFQAVRRLIDIL